MTYYASPISEKILKNLKKQGFSLPNRPASTPELPSDLSELSDEDLVQRMLEFTSWCDFAEAQVGLAVISEREAELQLEAATGDVWTAAYKEDPKKSVTYLKVASLASPSVREARDDYEEAYAYRRMVSDIAAKFDRDASILSRELTRRTNMEFGSRQRRRDRFLT